MVWGPTKRKFGPINELNADKLSIFFKVQLKSKAKLGFVKLVLPQRRKLGWDNCTHPTRAA